MKRSQHATTNALLEAVQRLNGRMADGVVTWQMPDGRSVRVVNGRRGERWAVDATWIDGERYMLDRNMLFDSPFMRGERDARIIRIRYRGDEWTYDFRRIDRPQVVKSRASGAWLSRADLFEGPVGLRFHLVSGGEFPLGSPLSEGRPNERPQRWVQIDPFYISETEVTVSQYKQYLADTSSARKPPSWYWDEWGTDGDRAITCVAWSDAQAFCEWLSAKSGLRIRLPTEAEWEKAAKGYTHRRYPWGDEYDGSQAGSPNMTYLPVRSKPVDRSPFGAYDMAGNVWEWCADWYSDKAYGTLNPLNPTGPETGEYRVLRGCGWNYDPDTFRASYRSRWSPETRSIHIGFRVVREIE